MRDVLHGSKYAVQSRRADGAQRIGIALALNRQTEKERIYRYRFEGNVFRLALTSETVGGERRRTAERR